MMHYYLAVLFLALSVGGVVVRKTYYYIPLREMKRRAKKGDPLASKLYPAVSYTNSIRGLLLGFIVFTSATGVVLLSREAPFWLGLIAIILLLWLVYSWIPASRTTTFGVWLTTLVNPLVFRIVGYLHRLLDRPTAAVEHRLKFERRTGLYEKDDLVQLIAKQQHQSDSRFEDKELQIVKQALSFSDHTVSDILTSKKRVKTVLLNDTVGPVLIDEIHKSNQSQILVKETRNGDPVGVLNYSLLGIHSTGKVRDYTHKKLCFVHEDDRLSHALHALFVTGQSLAVVVDNSEKYIGVVRVEDFLKFLLGDRVYDDEVEDYMSKASVVRSHKQYRKHRDGYDDDEEESGDKDLIEEPLNVDVQEPLSEDTSVKTEDKVIK